MSMSIFQLELTRKVRTFSPAKLIPILLLLAYCLLMLHLYVSSGEFSIADFGILRLVVYFGISDLLLKFIFQKRNVTFPMYVSVQPVSARSRKLFELSTSLFDFWNYYGLLLFVPIFLLFDNATLVIAMALLNIVISFTNCFVLRIFEKTNKLICRIATLLLPAYYILLSFFIKNGVVTEWGVVGVQVVVLFAVIYLSLIIKCYNEHHSGASGFYYSGRISAYSMEILPLLRAKRLRVPLILMIPYIFLILYYLPVDEPIVARVMFLFCVLFAICLTEQFNFGIEANYWHQFDVSPSGVKAMFNRKFNFFFFFGLAIMALCTPVIFYREISVLYFVAVFFAVVAFYNFTQLLNFLFIRRIDIWVSHFMNSQGSGFLTCICQLIPVAIIFGTVAVCEFLGCFIVECIVFIVLGAVSLLVRHKAYDLFYKIYRKNRYSIMERFSSN